MVSSVKEADNFTPVKEKNGHCKLFDAVAWVDPKFLENMMVGDDEKAPKSTI